MMYGLSPGEVVTALVALGAFLAFMARVWPRMQLRAQLEAKDEILKTKDEKIAALEGRLATVQDDVRGLQDRAGRAEDRVLVLERELAGAAARYDEAMRYTAQPALERLEASFRDLAQQLVDHDKRIDIRFTELLGHLANQ